MNGSLAVVSAERIKELWLVDRNEEGTFFMGSLPGNSRVVEFGNMQTSGVSIFVHTILYFGLITIFLIAIGVHITTG
ncbi:hypothetical protein HS088_TW04G00672 [Tripterygium wilfordii]|uniref:Uncharacterized protein n=1 Tax=Tripterygium wilfordii TaxID=458696 RepID=A0A7J7DRC9_TRIWF|nr:hypothetical protein HS088_TW04G00672 [Tripterygium wilfordii]